MPKGAYQHPMVNASHFSMEPRSHVPRSAFDVRHFHKTSFGAGQLIPVYIREVLPGDSMRVHMSSLVRLAPMIVPAMDNLALHSYFFFIPNRLTWTHWEEFMGASDDPTAAPTQYLVPQITDIGNVATRVGKLADYFGITNNQSGTNVSVNALPFRGYNLVWNYWFRDPALIPAAVTPLTDGPDVIASYPLQAIQKAKDYFTTARPYPATSPEFVNSPAWVAESGFTQGPLVPGGRFTFGGTHNAYGVGVPVTGLGIISGAGASAGAQTVNMPGNRQVTASTWFRTSAVDFMMEAQGTATYPDVRVMVNDMRTAMMIQRYLEADQRGGTQYSMKNWFHFGVRSPDARLQNPEFLGGGRTMVTVNPVAQTAPTYTAAGTDWSKTAQGSLSATGYAAARGHGFAYSFVEHGYVIGVVAIRGDLTYQQGIDRLWRRRTPFDFYTPETANLGEQAIMSSEIFSDGSASDNNVFGYQERWAEYRNAISRTSGFLRSIAVDSAGVASTIDMWHYGQKFAARPTLNGVFLIEDPAVARTLQSSAPYAATFFGDFMFEERMVRPLPMFSIPGVGGRF